MCLNFHIYFHSEIRRCIAPDKHIVAPEVGCIVEQFVYKKRHTQPFADVLRDFQIYVYRRWNSVFLVCRFAEVIDEVSATAWSV